MKISKDEYLAYFEEDFIDKYNVKYDIAEITLKDYCENFPTDQEFNEMNTSEQEYVKKILCYQIYYIDGNPDIFSPGNNDYTGFSIGNFSMSGVGSSDSSNKSTLDTVAKMLMDQSGRCSQVVKIKRHLGCDYSVY